MPLKQRGHEETAELKQRPALLSRIEDRGDLVKAVNTGEILGQHGSVPSVMG